MSSGWMLIAPAAVSLCLYALACSLALGWRIAVCRPRRGRGAPGLTIFKPLCGIDEGLEANLASFFLVDHEPLQVIFAVADPADPALGVVRRLMRRFPGRDVSVLVGADDAIPNPKVALLERMEPHARHDVFLLSDSNVRLRDGEIRRVLQEFSDDRVGMVYQPVVAVGERTVPAAVENLRYTELAALLTIGARVLAGQHTVNGKGQWVRRAALADVGGFTKVRDCGADDYELSVLVAAAGWELRMAGECVQVVQRDWSWSSLAARNLRHGGLRWRICPVAYPLELACNPIPWALPLLAGGSRTLAIAGAAAVIGKILLEVSVARLLRGGPLPGHFVPVILVKDLYVFACWFVALFARTAAWRGRLYKLCPRGRIEPIAAATPAPELARPRAA